VETRIINNPTPFMGIDGGLDNEILVVNQVGNSLGALEGDDRNIHAKALNPIHYVRNFLKCFPVAGCVVIGFVVW